MTADPTGLRVIPKTHSLLSTSLIIWLLDSSAASCPTTFPLPFFLPITPSSSLFLEHIKHTRTSGPLHLLFPRRFLPQIFTRPSLMSCRSLLKCPFPLPRYSSRRVYLPKQSNINSTTTASLS